jgi:ATP-dependent helicase/nuclease subunit A
MIIDQKARNAALDPRESFIVQAPAGAGKTELITQRFLALLATVQEHPEEILAVTFTKKAAGEMRSRIINALIQARAQNEPPIKEHELKTWQLAKAVLSINDVKAWQLIENPNRLRIVTIDALCAKLVSKMPILSQVGGDFGVVEYARALYDQAARALLSQTTETEKWSHALRVLLLHCDNRIEKIVNLLVLLLSKRDQWLPYLGYLSSSEEQLQAYFDNSLKQLIENHLEKLASAFPLSTTYTLMALASEAAKVCASIGKSDKIAHLQDCTTLPMPIAASLPLWQGLGELLLTKDGSYRKRLDQSVGFLSQSAAKDKQEKAERKATQDNMKAVMLELNEVDGLSQLLAEVELLPDPFLSSQHVSVLKALGELLPVLVAHLQVIFQETGKIDFIEVNLRASNALGDDLEPSEILLKLDYQLRHILIDEYQDTSVSQYHLFEKLVAGWHPGDGRTLFLVGDPMQSIYRFRGAEVSLFLHTQENGLGAISLTPLTLQVNFRSNEKVIDWINHTFVDIFPNETNKTFGGIPYSRAFAAKGAIDESKVELIPVQKGHEDMAAKAVDVILEKLAKDPLGSIAVLARTRKHLSPIIALLKQLNIAFVAHEVDYLAKRMHVIDCVSLLRAMTDLTDKISWYAILRAPWLGLGLSDIFAISQHNPTGIVWNALLQYETCKGLSNQAQSKLIAWMPRMQFWLANRRRKPLHEWIRGLWLLLGGNHCYQETVQKDLDAVFKLIGDCETGGTIPDWDTFEERLGQLYADVEHIPEAQSGETVAIELLTLHKAKGLEFDTVIMPYLHTRPKRNDPALLLWFEYALTSEVNLLLAPYRFVGQAFDPLYRYVDHCLSQKDRFEIARLLYVGVTRAKNHLVLLGEYEFNEKGEIKPAPKGSFWEMLTPHVDTQLSSVQTNHILPSVSLRENQRFQLKDVYEIPPDISLIDESRKDLNHPEVGDFVARCTGTVFHRMLQRLTSGGDVINSPDLSAACQLALKRMGLTKDEQNEALRQVLQAIENLKSDEKGRWIVDPSHQARKSEWALSYKAHHGVENIIIDYSFVDKEGVRWIIDYKLTHHLSLSQSELADEQAKYRKQLEKYRKIVSSLERRPVRCALYFPLAKVFSEIENGVLND